MEKIKIILADDEPLFRKGISLLIQRNEDMEIIFEAANGKELVNFLQYSSNIPDIIIVDLKMPVLNGVEATKFLQDHFPGIRIIVLTNMHTRAYVNNMVSLGVSSYLVKDTTPQELINAIQKVHKMGSYYNEGIKRVISEPFNSMAKKKISRFSAQLLTKREVQVLKLICRQYSSVEIAERLFLSPRTVEGHKSNLLQKTESKNTIGLIVYALLHDHVDLHHLMEYQ
ncbi:response regulator transcription factor [Pedobacter sp. ASV28]|uniref:response regulator transcription factor n=1 Tax=Pedobacter sp. ASV28 TaxID=2795123 RepID=UPI0018EAB2F4|nr:response regulator transcription factor [Pedobacter sp. ASV28]